MMLIVLLWLLLQTAPVQNYIKDQVLAILSERYGAHWSIGHIEVDPFDQLELTDVVLLDQQSDTLLAAQQLSVDIGIFSLLKKEIVIDKVYVKQLRSHLYDVAEGKTNYAFLLNANENKSTSDGNSTWSFDIGQIVLDRVSVDYNIDSLELAVRQSFVDITVDQLDIKGGDLAVERVLMEEGSLMIRIPSAAGETSAAALLPDLGLSISLGTVLLVEQQIAIHNGAYDVPLQSFSTLINDVEWQGNTLTADIATLQATVNHYPTIERFAAQVSVDSTSLSATSLSLQTQSDRLAVGRVMVIPSPLTISSTSIDASVSSSTISLLRKFIPPTIRPVSGTILKVKAAALDYSPDKINLGRAVIDYGRALQLSADAKVELNADGKVNYVSGEVSRLKSDVQKLQHVFSELSLPAEVQQFKSLQFSGRVDGSTKRLRLRDITVKLDDKVALELSGSLRNMGSQSAPTVDLSIRALSADMAAISLPQLAAVEVKKLGSILYEGKVVGGLADLRVDGTLSSALGGAVVDAQLRDITNSDLLAYDGRLQLDDFDLGTLLGRTDIGRLSLTTDIKGIGDNMQTAGGKLSSTIASFQYNGYDYRNIEIDADLSLKRIQGTLAINDENISLTYEGELDIEGNIYKADFISQIDTLILAPLGFVKDTFGISGTVRSQFSLPLKPGEKGQLTVSNLRLSSDRGQYQEDSIQVLFAKEADSTFIDLDSDFMRLSVRGIYGVRDLPRALLRQVEHYYPIGIDSTKTGLSKSASIVGTIFHLRPVDILTPQNPIGIKHAEFDLVADFADYSVTSSAIIDSLIYDNTLISSTTLEVKSTEGSLAVDIDMANVARDGNLLLPIVKMSHQIESGQVLSDFEVMDTDQLPTFKFGSDLQSTADGYLFSLADSIILNKTDWLVDANNLIQISDGAVRVEEFTLYNDNEVLSISSLDTLGNDFRATFDNFDLGQFATVLTEEKPVLQLALNGEVTIKNAREQTYYIADLVVDSIVYDGKLVGQLALKASEDSQSRVVQGQVSLVGPDNDMLGKGTYDPSSTEVDINLDAARLEMRLLDPFLSTIIDESRGAVAAIATVSGPISKPSVKGNMRLKDAATTIVVNNSRYTVADHTIAFDNKTIDLTGLQVTDRTNNKATVDGFIRHQNLDNILLDISVNTEKFQFLNTTLANNPIFYGKLMLAARATISGPPDLLDVQVVATTLDSTDLTLSPFSETETLLQEDFIHYGKPSDLAEESTAYLLRMARKFPFDVSATMTATPEARMTFVVNPLTGDKIVASGAADLKVNINSSGEQEIYGRYEVSTGSYSFSYGDFIAKKIDIKPGGSISFNGDPLQAKLDIQAVYKVYTTTYELVKNEISINESEVEAAKQRTDVEVLLSMQGSLLEPQIYLDIQIPEQQSATAVGAVDRKLSELRNNPNELNNQVFGLLIFDSFLISDNSNSGINTLGSSIALNSISGLVTSQLNRLANDLITGVDINIDVNSYNSSYTNSGAGGNVTEIGLQVSKQLFNDRLSVQAGTNLNLDNSVGSRATSIVGDFILEYKITESGSYKVRVFTKTDYDRLVNENATKSGVSLFFSKSFDTKTEEK